MIARPWKGPAALPSPLRATAAVSAALGAGRPLVALESSVLAQGLPAPHNRHAHELTSAAVAAAGAEPAVTAVVHGEPWLGLEDEALERFLDGQGVVKLSARDLGPACAKGLDGATTVAATLALCTVARIPVFATGGIGGVHREPPFDESADLLELARSPVIVVCAGAKSILDLPATMERLETVGVPVLGYRTTELPGFFTTSTGIELTMRVDDPGSIARAYLAHRALGRPGALLVVQPPPAAAALPADLVDNAVAEALWQARRQDVRGAAVTPFLLAAVEKATGGKSLAANLALLEANARLAGEIAVELAAMVGNDPGAMG